MCEEQSGGTVTLESGGYCRFLTYIFAKIKVTNDFSLIMKNKKH